ncbi:hypothetical protein BDR07DRAFT_1475327 [Suillus spraguei]|nr:hypothetical protein BDR07DRAFT_1475327 [Suillus spraguei]
MSSAPSRKFLPSPKTVASKLGVDKGPIHLVQAGLIEELGWRVVFDGHHQFEDISFLPDGIQVNATTDPAVDTLSASIARSRSPLLVAQVCESVASAVQAHTEMGHLPVTLGGDHSLAMATISGTMRAYDQACVIWIDVHADINTIYSTDNSVFAKFDWVSHLPAERLIYIGLRDSFSMHEVDCYGIGKVRRPIHLRFDIYVLDPSVAPSTGTPVRGKLTFREGHYIYEAVHKTGLIAALDLMSVHQTVPVGSSLVRSALGKSSI